jgi:4-hydroxythreonine-4-phosphate dehydrogenase
VKAVADAMRGTVDGVATAPINKEALRLAGLPWSGHTDLLAHLTGAEHVAMMFYSDALRVVLATVHLALAEVPRALTPSRLEATIELTSRDLPRFGIERPRIAVAGLNPHAGEHGLFGREEEDVIGPAIAACRRRGIDVAGPFPADTLFVRAVRGEFDVVVACYHDQGLIPVKLVAFGQAVNVTLGLPIIRTSVDHGTAFDIAGQGLADPGSMCAAVKLAARLAAGRPDEAANRR